MRKCLRIKYHHNDEREREKKNFTIWQKQWWWWWWFVDGAPSLSILGTNLKPICISCLLCFCFSMLFASYKYLSLSLSRALCVCASFGWLPACLLAWNTTVWNVYSDVWIRTKNQHTSLYHFGYLRERIVFVREKKERNRIECENCYAKNPLIGKRRSISICR